MATFRVPIANRLDDTSLLLRELNAAWGFMREKYPGSVHAAMACRVRLLKGLDPRFDYRVTVVDGNDHVELHPIEPVQFTLSVTGEPDAVAVKLKDFVGQGEALKADGNIGIEVTGSPIFALGKIVSVSMTPRRPVEARLFAELKGRGRVHFPEFRGNLDGGTELLKFEGRLPRCPLSVLVTARRHDADAGKLTFTWKWNPTVWVGHPLASLPWIDPLLQLLNALGDPAATLGFTLTSHGQHIGEGIAAEQANLEHVRAIHPYVDFLGKAKRVASVLHLPVVVPREWTEEDFQDVEELYSLVTTGRYDHRGTFGFTCTIARLASSVVEGLVKRPSEHLQLSNHGSRYNFLGDSFDFSDTHIQLSHWTNVSAEDVTEAGEPLTKLQLSRCRQTVVWPRFLPEKPQDAASP